MIEFRVRPERVLATPLVAAAWLVLCASLVAPPATIAAADASPNPLDATIADVAVLPGGEPGEVRLLTLADRPAPALAVLERDGERWRRAAAVDVSVDLAAAAREAGLDPGALDPPWLLRLRDERFVLVVTAHAAAATLVASVDAAGDGVRVGGWRRLPLAVEGAGVADVGGGGDEALVVVGAAPPRRGATCQGSTIAVLDRRTLAVRFDHTVENLRLGLAALADVVGTAAAELVAYAFRNCPAGTDSPERRVAVAIDLTTGVVDEIDRAASTAARPSSGAPLAADLDGDGRVEVILRSGSELVVLEPSRRWHRSVVAGSDALPVGLRAWDAGSRGRLAAIDEDAITIGELHRTEDGFAVEELGRLDASSVGAHRWQLALASIRAAAVAGAPPAGTWMVRDEADCPGFVMPLAVAWCRPGASPEELRGGAAWVGTRPIAVVGPPSGRKLLVAESVEWLPWRGLPVPAPLAAHEDAGGSWRIGPSPRFVLGEVLVADLRYFARFPVPTPTMERTSTGNPAVVRSAGVAGMRFIAAVVDDPAPAGGGGRTAPPLEVFLRDGGGPFARSLVRLPVLPGHEAGIDHGFASIPLGDEPEAVEAGAADEEGWLVTLAALNVWGEIAEPIRQRVLRDRTGPRLAFEPPLFSAPWPFAAPIRGVAEPGAAVSLDGGSRTEATRRGTFELRAALAPWPQTLVLRAVDESGNTTVERVSVVGGVDYRRLPWEWILAAVILAGVSIATLRDARGPTVMLAAGQASPAAAPRRTAWGARRALRRDVAWGDDDPDGGPVPEIEDLPSRP